MTVMVVVLLRRLAGVASAMVLELPMVLFMAVSDAAHQGIRR